MKRNMLNRLAAIFLLLFGMVSCSNRTDDTPENTITRSEAQIFLYAEKHGIDEVIQQEFEIWHDHYHNDGMRQLFLESPYYTCEFLNIWMQADNDDILDAIYDDLEGTPSHVPAIKDFYQKIKEQCPETIFHGTDVGHQFFSTGERYLEYLRQNNLEDSEQYLISQEVIEQGQYFYESSDDVYRENKMTENFIRAFDSLNDEKIMGILGASQTGLNKMDYTGKIACIANQLKEHYGNIIYTEIVTKK